MFWNSTETETTGPVKSERPAWLGDEESGPSGKDWDTSEPAVSSDPTMDLSPTSSSGGRAEKQKSSETTKGPWCMRLFIVSLSLLFLGAFIYSAVVQKNDGKDAIEWYIFYSISAAIPAFFLCQYILCFPAKIIYLLSAGMTIWGTAFVILIALKLKDTPEGGADTQDGKTAREELIMELAGASVALFSALYHACASRCCVSDGKAKDVE